MIHDKNEDEDVCGVVQSSGVGAHGIEEDMKEFKIHKKILWSILL